MLQRTGFLFMFGLLALSAPTVSQAVDKTLDADAGGVDVVEAVVLKIRRSAIFPNDDFNLLTRLAHVQTRFGSQLTLDPKYDGGIWGPSNAQFTSTIQKITPQMSQQIHTEFGISWNTTLNYKECRKPLISGLAAYLLVHLNREVSEDLQTMEEQGDFLSEIQLIAVTSDAYSQQSLDLEKSFPMCSQAIDLTIVMGGTSIDTSTFENTTALEKKFVKNLFASFPKAKAVNRFGLISIKGDQIETSLELTNPFNDQEIQWVVQSTGYSSEVDVGKTRINEEIRVAVDMVNRTLKRSAPKFMLVFSHSESSESGAVSNIAYARRLGLKTVALTVGAPTSQQHADELLNLADGDNHNLWRTSEIGLDQLHWRLGRELCQIQTYTNYDGIGTLLPGEKRFFNFHSYGFNYHLFKLTSPTTLAKLKVFVSYTEEFPSSAIFDLELTGPGEHVIPIINPGDFDAPTYFTIQSIEETQTVDFNFYMTYLDTTTSTSTTTSSTSTDSTTTSTTPSASSPLVMTSILFFVTLLSPLFSLKF